MAIQAMNNFNGVANFGFANPVHNLGRLAITMFAMHIISNLPGATAKEALSAERQACEIACEPLPGGKDDAPEQICVKTCEEGAEIIKTKTKEVMKDGKWKTVEVLGKVATPIAGYFDCTSVCDPATAITQEAGLMGRAGYHLLNGEKAKAILDATHAAAKAACTATLVFGQYACMACCAGIKYIGVA